MNGTAGMSNNCEQINLEKDLRPPPSFWYTQWCTDTIRSFRAQIIPSQPWFEMDRETTDNFDANYLFSSTSPTRRAGILFWKISCFILSIFTMGFGFHTFGSFYMAYFTHWSLLATTIYFLVSLSATVSVVAPEQDPETETSRIHEQERQSFQTKLAWLFFEVACHSQIAATIGYWPSVLINGGQSLKGLPFYYNDAVCHGLLCILVLVDGRLIHKIPFRWMHWAGFVLPFDALYLVVWLPLYEVLVGKNPMFEDQKWIYPLVKWRDNWPLTLVLSFLGLFLSFVLFGLLWLTQRYHERVHRPSTPSNRRQDEDNAV